MAAMQDREDQAHKGSRSTLNGKYDMVDVRVVHGARCMLQVAAAGVAAIEPALGFHTHLDQPAT